MGAPFSVPPPRGSLLQRPVQAMGDAPPAVAVLLAAVIGRCSQTSFLMSCRSP